MKYILLVAFFFLKSSPKPPSRILMFSFKTDFLPFHIWHAELMLPCLKLPLYSRCRKPGGFNWLHHRRSLHSTPNLLMFSSRCFDLCNILVLELKGGLGCFLLQQINDHRVVSNTYFFLMQAAAHAAHPTVASAPLAACAKERHVTPVAVSDGSASSAFSVHVMEPV